MPFASAPVLIFGEVLADIFPERTTLGGAPFNVACHLAAFGENPLFITRTGKDPLQDALLQRMHKFNMSTKGVQIDPDHATGQVEVHIDNQGGHVFSIKADQAYDYIDADQALAVAREHQPHLFYFGTLAQRNKVSRMAFRALHTHLRCKRVSDINLRLPWYTVPTIMDTLTASDVVKMSLEELQLLAHELQLSGSAQEQWARDLAERFSLERLLITCGGDGAWQWRQEGKTLHAPPAQSSSAVGDTVGAGDAFTAVILLGLLHNWPDQLSLNRANAFARAICTIRGAIPDDSSFYTPFLEAWHG